MAHQWLRLTSAEATTYIATVDAALGFPRIKSKTDTWAVPEPVDGTTVAVAEHPDHPDVPNRAEEATLKAAGWRPPPPPL